MLEAQIDTEIQGFQPTTKSVAWLMRSHFTKGSTMSEDHKVSRKENLLGLFSHMVLNR